MRDRFPRLETVHPGSRADKLAPVREGRVERSGTHWIVSFVPIPSERRRSMVPWRWSPCIWMTVRGRGVGSVRWPESVDFERAAHPFRALRALRSSRCKQIPLQWVRA